MVATHPDDAEIAAFGVYASNRNSHVVTVTAGEGGEFDYDEFYEDSVEHYREKGKIRTWNSISVPLLGGLKPDQVINLGFFDRSLPLMYEEKTKTIPSETANTSDIDFFRGMNISRHTQGLTGQADWVSLVENLEYLLESIQPEVIITPHPYLDSHPDHQLTTIAVIEAVKRVGLKKGQFLFYSNHPTACHYHPIGRRGSVVSLPFVESKGVYFNSVYSHTVSESIQKSKLLALEAMNDLRMDTEWLFFSGALRHAYKTAKKAIYGIDNSYYRKAVRANELFLVVDFEEIYDEQKLARIVYPYLM